MSLTLGQRRAWARHGAREIQRTIDAAKRELAEDAAAERDKARAAYAERVKLVPFTADELAAATHVRTDTGWHKVVRVSTKSVTVETGYSWTDRYALGKVVEVRRIDSENQC